MTEKTPSAGLVFDRVRVRAEVVLGDNAYTGTVEGGTEFATNEDHMGMLDQHALYKVGDAIFSEAIPNITRSIVRYRDTGELGEDGLPIIVVLGEWPIGEEPPLDELA